MSRVVNLHFPTGGLNKRLGLQTQPPYTTPDCLNVRAADAGEGRERGGSRPGLVKVLQQRLGAAGDKRPVRMIGEIQASSASSVLQWKDPIDNNSISNQGWVYEEVVRSHRNVTGHYWYCNDEDGERLWAFKDFSATQLAQEMWLETTVTSHRNPKWGSIYLCLGVSALSDVKQTTGYTGLIARLAKNDDDTCDITLSYVIAGVTQALGGYTPASNQSWPSEGFAPTFKLWVENTACKVYYDGAEVISCTLPGTLGNRGIGLQIQPDDGYDIGVGPITYQYNELARIATHGQLVMSAGGELYTLEEDAFTESELTLDASLNWLNRVRCAPLLGKLYIADYSTARTTLTGVTVAGTNVGADFDRDRLTKAGAAWGGIGSAAADTSILVDSDVAVCYNGVDDTVPLKSISGDHLNLDRNLVGAGTSCTVRVERGLKVYDPVAGTLTVLDSTEATEYETGPPIVEQVQKGQVPQGCPLICTFSGRLFVAGQETAPHAWYACRQGDAQDWDYSQTDPQAACAGIATDDGTEAGKIFDAITALAPFSSDYLVMGCRNSLWVMRGDPGAGGVLDLLSTTVGIVSGDAWAMMPDGSLVFLSVNGLYYLPPGAGGFPQPFSTEVMPRELLGLDPNQYDVLMSYDAEAEGIHLYVVPKSGGAGRHWWVDWKSKSFWPVSLQLDHHPTALFMRANGELILGCRDGYLRAYDLNAVTDDGEDIDSYVVYGPMRLSSNLMDEGLARELVGVLGDNSGDVTWSMHVGSTAGEALDGVARESGTWGPGRSMSAHPRARGMWGILKLSSTEPWQIEAAEMILRDGGKWRYP